MSASQTTTNYNLPVFEPNDVPAWLTDWNSAMGDIDTAIAGAKTTADTAQLTASGAANGVSTLNTTVGNLQTTVGNQGSTITSLGNSLNTVQSLIGNGTPTTTDQTIIGAINEINAAYKDAANIKFDNTGTGMSATNVQAAIVEAYGSGGGGGTAANVSYDNTDSGLTATNVQAAIDEVVTLSNVRWNSTTDRFEVLKNGSWTQSIRAFVNSLAVWVAGQFGITMDNGSAQATSSAASTGAFVADGNNLKVELYTAAADEYFTLVSNEAIDFTNYSTITVKNNKTQDIVVNVSGYNRTGYLGVYLTLNGTYLTKVGACVASQKSDFLDNAVSGLTGSESVQLANTDTVNITEITVE